MNLGEMPDHIRITCSGNMIKNVKGVIVPNSGGQKGIEAAAVLGVVGGNADRMLEVIAGADDEARQKTRELVAAGICDVQLAENVPNLYIKAEMWTKDHEAAVTIEEHHTDITEIQKDGTTVFIAESSGQDDQNGLPKGCAPPEYPAAEDSSAWKLPRNRPHPAPARRRENRFPPSPRRSAP